MLDLPQFQKEDSFPLVTSVKEGQYIDNKEYTGAKNWDSFAMTTLGKLGSVG